MTGRSSAWLVVHTATGYVEKAAYTEDERAAMEIEADDSGGKWYLARVKSRVHAQAMLTWCQLLAFGSWSLVRTDIFKRDGAFVEPYREAGQFIGYSGALAAAARLNAVHEGEGFVWDIVPDHPDARRCLAVLRRYVVTIQKSRDMNRWPHFGSKITPYTRRRGDNRVTVWRGTQTASACD